VSSQKPVRGEAWFEQGYAAFKASFPSLAATVPFAPFYVCPLCLTAYGLDVLHAKALTREHVPPESVGGQRMVLTCWKCNNDSGTGPDSHARLEADIYDFAAGNLREIKAAISTEAGRVPVRLSRKGSNIQAAGVVKAVHPDVHKNVMGDFESRVTGRNADDLKFSIEFRSFSMKQAGVSWLRSAYLAFFATLGYRFVRRPELDVVRDKIKNPEQDEPSTFRVIRPESAEPTLAHIDTPESFRSYLMLYGRNAVFLPREGDRDLYRRLAEHPGTSVTFTGKQYPWPGAGPTFFYDSAPLTER
jgi:hypothetical protein